MKVLRTTLIIKLMILAQSIFSQNHDLALRAFELRMNGVPYSALNLLDSALKIYPDSARLWFEKGRCLDWIKTVGCVKFRDSWYILKPNLRSCRHCFKKACRLDPENARYQFWAAENAGMIALLEFYTPWNWPFIPFSLRYFVKHLKIASDLDPENPDYMFELVNAYHVTGSARLARAYADTLNSIDPVYGVLAYDLISTSSHPYDALSHFKELEQSNPDNLKILVELALIYSDKDSTYLDTSLNYLKKILELDPPNLTALKRLYFKLPNNRKDDIIGYILNFLKASEHDYTYYSAAGLRMMALYFKQQGDKSMADLYYSAANQLSSDEYNSFIKDLSPP